MNKMLENIENQGTMLSLEYFDVSKNKSSPWGVYCAIFRHCRTNKLTLCGDEGMKEYIKEIADSLQENTMLHSLALVGVGKIGVESIKVLMNNVSLKRLNFSSEQLLNVAIIVSILCDNDDVRHRQLFLSSSSYDFICTQTTNPIINLSSEGFNDDAAYVLAFSLHNNTTVEELNLSCTHLTNEGTMVIIDCLKHNRTLKKLDLSSHGMNINGLIEIVKSIENQWTMLSLEYFDVSKNKSSLWGVYCAIIRCCCTNSLTLCGDEGMKEYITEIADSLQANATLQSFTLLGVGKIGVESIKELLMNNVSLKELKASWERVISNILCEVDKVTISVNVSILYDNNDANHIQLLSELVCTRSCKSNSIIDLSCKIINDDAVYILAFGLCNNTTVEVLYISHNKITDEGAVAIVDCLKYNKIIKKLDLSQNAVSIVME